MALEIKDFTEFDYLWKNNGQLPSGEKVQLMDALATTNAPLLFPKVITNVVREAAEPLLVGTSLLQRINHQGGASIITFPSVGAMTAADIAEGMEYPEQAFNMGGASVTANVGKSGLAVRVTEEMIRGSQFDVIGMLLRNAGRALARHKEVKIFNMIRAMGVTVFDNKTPSASLKGVTTGRSLDGSPNGSVTMDDVFDAWAQVVMQGFTPNVMLMHPLTWTMFMKDATMRHFVLSAGGGNMLPQMWTGNPSNLQAEWVAASQGGMGLSAGQSIVPPGGSQSGAAATSLTELNPQQNGAPVFPNYFGLAGGFRIVVSPFVPFDVAKRTTDIYLFDANNLGVLIVDEEIQTEEFNDPARDIRKIKLRERYAVGILNEGFGIAVLRNVKVLPNEVVLPAQATIDIAGSIAPVPPGTPIL